MERRIGLGRDDGGQYYKDRDRNALARVGKRKEVPRNLIRQKTIEGRPEAE